MLLNFWTWDNDELSEMKNEVESVKKRMFDEIENQKIEERIRKRTRIEWYQLYFKRFVLIFLNLLVLIGSIWALIWIQSNTKTIIKFIEQLPFIPSGISS